MKEVGSLFGNGKLKTKDQIICMMLREKWAPVEESRILLLPSIARLSIPAFRRFKRKRAGDPGSNPGRSTFTFKIKVKSYVANHREPS